jgi:hypothetical protein
MSAIRVDLQTKLECAAASVSSMKLDIVKRQETLEDHQKDTAFLEIMTMRIPLNVLTCLRK